MTAAAAWAGVARGARLHGGDITLIIEGVHGIKDEAGSSRNKVAQAGRVKLVGIDPEADAAGCDRIVEVTSAHSLGLGGVGPLAVGQIQGNLVRKGFVDQGGIGLLEGVCHVVRVRSGAKRGDEGRGAGGKERRDIGKGGCSIGKEIFRGGDLPAAMKF